MDEIAADVHRLVRQVCRGDLNESEFTTNLFNIRRRHSNTGNIARAISKGLSKINADDSERSRVWQLAKSVDEDISPDPESNPWFDASNWDLG